MKCALRVAEHDEVIEPKEAFSLVAITAYYCSHFGQCSKAFVRLESLPGLTQAEREAYAALALDIFMRNPPADPASRAYHCPKCNNGSLKEWHSTCKACGTTFASCVASGRIVLNRRTVTCTVGAAGLPLRRA